MAQLRIAETDTEGIEEIDTEGIEEIDTARIEENANFQTELQNISFFTGLPESIGQVLKSLYKALSRKLVQDRRQERLPVIVFHGFIALANLDPIYRPC